MHTLKKSYIPEELCKAPDYHLAQNTNKQLPQIEPGAKKTEYLDSLAEISAFQVFEEIPGIKKSRIVLDSVNSLEIWKLMPDRVLIREDIEFLKQDSKRVEAIVERLIWLGASWLSSEILDQKVQIQSWGDVIQIIQQYNYDFDLININHSPFQISLEKHKNKFGQINEYWNIYPPCWNICLNQTRAFNGCYIVDDYNSGYNFMIEVWAGIPFFRNAQTGEVVTMASL